MTLDSGDVETLEGASAELDAPSSSRLRGLALQMIHASNGNREEAIGRLIEAIRIDADLREVVLYVTARYMIRHIEFALRRDLKSASARFVRADDASGLVALGALASRWLDDFHLPNGVLLGDATADDLNLARAKYLSDSAAAAKSAEFVKRIAAKVRNNKSVRTCLTDKACARIWESIK